MLFVTFLFFLLISLCACQPSVIIVGAGVSGIAAATKLLKNGISNITVLEAENRIGGRIYSVKLDNSHVDLGAEWCHGTKNNIVYDMLKDLNILRNSKDILLQIHHSKLKKLDQNFSNSLINIFDDIYNEPNGQGSNAGEYFIKRYKESIGVFNDDEYVVAEQAIDLFENYVLAYDGALSWFDLAIGGDFEECEGDAHVHWNGYGYKTILDVLMQKYPDASKSLRIDDKIILNKEVDQIIWNSDNIDGVVAKCSDGSTYTADYIITTVSLGVLKHQHNSLFVPKLPIDKVQAIEQLGIGGVLKVVIHFANRWWDNSYNGSVFLWDKDDLNRSLFLDGPVKNGKSWITSLSTIIAIPHHPNALEAWFTGDFIPDIEQCADSIVKDGIMYVLKYFQVIDSTSSIRPDKILRNNWYTNPHFRGTYSFQTPQSRQGNLSDEVILSKPLINNSQKMSLLFAGEATNPTHYSTVHGAIETGFREADRIIQFHN